MQPIIQLRNGKMLDLRDPDPSAIDIETIAWALSHIGRYTGHADRFLSVAEHCVHTSLIAPSWCAREALMHDAAEAFVGDVSSPLKSLLPGYREIEYGIHRTIAGRFNIAWAIIDEVKRADLLMLAVEANQCMPVMHSSESMLAWKACLPGITTADIVEARRKLDHLGRPPEQARKLFLDRAEELGLR